MAVKLARARPQLKEPTRARRLQRAYRVCVELVRGAPHAELEHEALHFLEVEGGGGELAQVHSLSGALGGDEGVPVAVARHPRREDDRRVVEGDARLPCSAARAFGAQHTAVSTTQPRTQISKTSGQPLSRPALPPSRTDVGERSVDAADELGKACEDGLLEVVEAPTELILWRAEWRRRRQGGGSDARSSAATCGLFQLSGQ